MRADKDSIDYQVNLVALQEMEEVVPMTLRERCCLRKWVRQGNEVESNPWNYMDSDGKDLTRSFFGMNRATVFSPKMNSFN